MAQNAIVISREKLTEAGAFLDAEAMVRWLGMQGFAACLSAESAAGGLAGALPVETEVNVHYALELLSGADLWNVRDPAFAGDAGRLGGARCAQRRIAYGAGTGTASSAALLKCPEAVKAIAALDGVAICDDTVGWAVRDVRSGDVVRVLPPVFLLDWPTRTEAPETPYLFVDASGMRAAELAGVEAFARARGQRTVVVGAPCAWADENPSPEPCEWLALLRFCEFALVSSATALSFALLNHRQFAMIGGNNMRCTALLNEFRVMDRVVSPVRPVEEIASETLDYAQIDERIAHRRAASVRALTALGFENAGAGLPGGTPGAHMPASDAAAQEVDAGKAICRLAKHVRPEVQRNSRSGGVFTALSDVVLARGGVVYGAVLEADGTVRHVRADTAETRDRMRGSKYAQSDMGPALRALLQDLEAGRELLFSGTPCQTDAVRALAQRKGVDAGLITAEILCNGVASPEILKAYYGLHPGMTEFNFRDKLHFGWDSNIESYRLHGRLHFSNVYMQLYTGGEMLRPSCYLCPYKRRERNADVTVYDAWSVVRASPEMNANNLGVSVMQANSEAGRALCEAACAELQTVTFAPYLVRQRPVRGCSRVPERRSEFWRDYRARGMRYVCETYSELKLGRRLRFYLSAVRRARAHRRLGNR